MEKIFYNIYHPEQSFFVLLNLLFETMKEELFGVILSSEAYVVSSKTTMTYEYYQKNVNPKPETKKETKNLNILS